MRQDPVETVLSEIRRRLAAAEQLLASGDSINRETVEERTQSVESAMRNLLRLQSHVPSQTYDQLAANLQLMLQSLRTMAINSHSRSFQILLEHAGTDSLLWC